MEETLRQLGELLLGSVPTIILLATLYILYTFLVYRPLTAVLAERRNRTQGAMEKARTDIAAAEARTADYEQRLREARQKVFKTWKNRRQQAGQVRAEAVNQARSPSAGSSQAGSRPVWQQDKQEAMVRLQSDAGRSGHRDRAHRAASCGGTQPGGRMTRAMKINLNQIIRSVLVVGLLTFWWLAPNPGRAFAPV